jgi:fatty-acyl-CoA synthase
MTDRVPHVNVETLVGRAAWLVENQPDDTAVILVGHGEDQPVTYREFFTRAARYAHALESAGIQPGDLIVLVLQHDESVLYSFWGALLLGAVPSIFPFLTEKLDPDRYFASVRSLVDLSGVRAVVTYQALEPTLREALAGIDSLAAILTVEQLEPGGSVDAYLQRTDVQPDEVAFLQHSSGSTGLQKGVMLSHRSVMNQIDSYSAAIALQRDDVIVSWLPLYHDMGLIAGFILPIVQGIPLVLMSPFHWVRDPKILLQAVHRYRGTLTWLPNFAYNFLALRVRDQDIDGLDLSSWRAVINCSEPVHAESHRIFLEKYTAYGFRPEALATCYAMAENTFAVTQSTVGSTPRVEFIARSRLLEHQEAVLAPNGTPNMAFVSCGQPVPDCDLRVVNADRRDVPERHVGEIALRSTSMLTGYYRRPEVTESVMADGWYFTGDMGYLADGELFITGRKKDLIIIGGKNIYPQDVENLLNDVEGIHPGRSVAFGVYNEQLGTEDLAIVAEADTDEIEVRAAALRTVRGRIVRSLDVTARYVHLVERLWLLKTSSGKVARAANREKFIQEVLNR